MNNEPSPIDKKELLSEVVRRLERELETHHSAAMEAKAAATHEENKAENKYDTRGLEASYLAAGQARRAKELQETLNIISRSDLRDYSSGAPLGSLALIKLNVEAEEDKLYFLVPRQGGERISMNGAEIVTLSLEAPLARMILGKTVGHYFDFPIRGESREHEIIQAW